MKKYFDVGYHYDSITEGWRYIFGDNFHIGYFKTLEDNLDRATDNLIDELASLCKLGPKTKILDAGCGIGAPAVYLYDKFGSDITGISISRKGVELANSRIQGNKYNGKIRFIVADMTSTGFPDKSFDVIWMMESSHLALNKALLFDECYRLLRPGGFVLLSDVLRSEKYNFVFKFKNIFQLVNMIKTFGGGITETPQRYIELLRKSSFKNIFFRDVSKETETTFNSWHENIIRNKNVLIKVFGKCEIKRFERSIETFKYLFSEKFKYYYLFRAEK
ncbi:MAG: methyltransferase domain-containing protein [Syntrophaceae bacterium]|nr:methyltransferase domain-containing protein [Syntrophaceae bacterium]